MRTLVTKIGLIEWREKVEDFHYKLTKNEKLSLDQMVTLLNEGVERGFLINDFTSCLYVISPDALNY